MRGVLLNYGAVGGGGKPGVAIGPVRLQQDKTWRGEKKDLSLHLQDVQHLRLLLLLQRQHLEHRQKNPISLAEPLKGFLFTSKPTTWTSVRTSTTAGTSTRTLNKHLIHPRVSHETFDINIIEKFNFNFFTNYTLNIFKVFNIDELFHIGPSGGQNGDGRRKSLILTLVHLLNAFLTSSPPAGEQGSRISRGGREAGGTFSLVEWLQQHWRLTGAAVPSPTVPPLCLASPLSDTPLGPSPCSSAPPLREATFWMFSF